MARSCRRSRAPFTYDASGLAVGTYTLTAVATDSQGAQTTSAARTFTVSSTNTPPTVSLVIPQDNTNWKPPATVTFQASVSSGEANDTVSVEFFANGTSLGTRSTSPFSLSSSVSAGTYTITAVATDGQGAQTTSTARTINVSDTNLPPTVAITSPAANASFPNPPVASISITSTASGGEINDSVSKVEFYANGTLIGTRTFGPFNFTWTNVGQGNYSLTAIAYDSSNSTTTSAAVSIRVGNPATLAFIEVDHLNTPRAVYDASQQLRWKWDQAEPFGVNTPNEDPSSLGAYELPVRFPGQYADKETNLSYNFFRDYDPNLGTYKGSDPLGLEAGVNTYAYVLAHPLGMTDPSGLINPVSAYWHYCFGNSKPMTISYTDVGVSGVTASNFASVAGASKLPCTNAVISINDSKAYTTTGLIFGVLGDVTLKLSGLLYTSCDCSWNFVGTLSVADDLYNMNRSTHRSWGEETATTLGRWFGKKCGATPYTIKIAGGEPITERGKLNGKPTCCGAP